MIRKTLFSLLFLSWINGHAQERKILVAAASDLKFAMDSVIRSFSSAASGKIDISYGSSGKLSEQIMNGAPFDVFFSADILYPEQLKKQQQVSSEIIAYAKGRIVLWSRKVNARKLGMNALLEPGVKKISIANPMHAPYGKRAVESLKHFQLYDKVVSKIVYGENISQAAQFISSGAADIGIIALSLARAPSMEQGSMNYFLIPEETHQPLIQAAVITQHGKDNELAQEFFNFVKTENAVSILTYFGFTKP